jgi:Glycine zipper
MKSQSHLAVLAILNAMLARVSSSLPQIEQATRGICQGDASTGVSVIDATFGKADV